jgi:acyl carrier protein
LSDNRQSVLEVIARVSGTPAAELRPEQNLVADLGLESPQALQLLVELEEALGVEISDEQAAAMESVGDVLAFVDRLG